MKSENNTLLHALANAVLVIVLVYAGEQYSGYQVKNDYIKYALWSSGIGISSFVASFPFGFLNIFFWNISALYDGKSRDWLLFDRHPVEEIKLKPEDAIQMIGQAQRTGYFALISNVLRYIERAFTFLGMAMSMVTPILFVIGVIIGK